MWSRPDDVQRPDLPLPGPDVYRPNARGRHAPAPQLTAHGVPEPERDPILHDNLHNLFPGRLTLTTHQQARLVELLETLDITHTVNREGRHG